MKALLVGIRVPHTDDEEFEGSLKELQRLVETLGFKVIGTLVQKRTSLSPATAIGAGKLKELASWTGGTGEVVKHSKPKHKAAEAFADADPEEDSAEASDLGLEEEQEEFPTRNELATHIVFDHELSPLQQKNLEQATGADVLDRTGVIVEIFHRHAKTREAKLQVEIARLNYLVPRMRATGPGERQGGGIGSKGVGETAYELDRRRIRDRVAELQSELKEIREDATHRRERRREQLRVALVGYTNAGKSSLMRALTGSEVLVADKLFATLDTTIRALQPEIFPRILISDTVGFIKKLPHDLVASFRSTLDEAKDASLLLYVVDASDPTFRSQLEVTKSVLQEIGATDIPSRLVLNKVDLLDVVQTHLLSREFPDAIQISTQNPAHVEQVKKIIRDFLTIDMENAEFVVPYDDQKGIIGEVRRNAFVVKETFEPEGVRLLVRSYPVNIAKIRGMLENETK